jgi:hypothetical protein
VKNGMLSEKRGKLKGNFLQLTRIPAEPSKSSVENQNKYIQPQLSMQVWHTGCFYLGK